VPFSSLNPQSRLTPRRGFWPALTGACLFTFSLLAAGAALAGDSQKTAGFIAEDLGRASLKQAIRNQLDAMHETDPEKKVRLGSRLLTQGKLRQGLADFLDLIEQNLPSEEFNRRLKERFDFVKVGTGRDKKVVFTGYYTPVISASPVRTKEYKYPLYRVPDNGGQLRLIGLAENNGDALKTRSWRKYTREQIDRQEVLKGQGLEIAWLKDDLERFFLHIQGSGWLEFPDGKRWGVRYLGANDHSYTGIGKLMIRDGVIDISQGSMQGIKKYLRDNPAALPKYFYQNKRYIFFTLTPDGPQGSGGGEVVAERSIATDKAIYPAGGLAFIRIKVPVVDDRGEIVRWEKVSRFVVDQDTGSDIRGPGRADLYFGSGFRAGVKAGHYKQSGEVYYLVPKS